MKQSSKRSGIRRTIRLLRRLDREKKIASKKKHFENYKKVLEKGNCSEKIGHCIVRALEREGWFTKAHFSKKFDRWDKRGKDAVIYTHEGEIKIIDFTSSIVGVHRKREQIEKFGLDTTGRFIFETKEHEPLEKAKQRFINEIGLERPYWLENTPKGHE